MHFELLVEDQSGKAMLDLLIPKIIQKGDTFKVHPYKGIGRIPSNLKGSSSSDPNKRILLDQLPRLLAGYGNVFKNYPETVPAVVIVVCDLDRRDFEVFQAELSAVLKHVNPRPETRFCIAIEEGEAWFLGDLNAIQHAYPKAKKTILQRYQNDSICGTWELLADAVYPGGATALTQLGYQGIGAEKSKWAKNITPHMDIRGNSSPSFNDFLKVMRDLAKLEYGTRKSTE
jgi:hypothetical protein